MWAIRNGRRLVYLGQGGVWHPLDDSGLGPGHIQTLFIDSSDTQWVVKEDVLYQRAAGQKRFTSTETYLYGPSKIAEYRDHSLLPVGVKNCVSPKHQAKWKLVPTLDCTKALGKRRAISWVAFQPVQ